MALPTSTAPTFARVSARGAAPPASPRVWGSAPLGAALAGLVGFAAFALVCGLRVLDPRNVAWLQHGGDPAQYLHGWTFFRASPWALPPGANPGYGLEIASSVFFTDSIPLLALLFKALRPLLDVEQYFGWWLLLCFVLQGVAGWLLMGLAVRGVSARLLGAALLCFAPPFLFRLNIHFALAGHWILLLALWLALAPPRPRRWPLLWGGLLLMASLVHSYLLAMAGALWASDLVRRAMAAGGGWRGAAARRLAAEALAVPALVAGGLWAGGFFVVRDGLSTGGGYGLYAMDLLAPFDSDGWSRVLPDLPDAPGRETGSNFLGPGLIGLLLAAVVAWLSRPALSRPRASRAPILVVLAGLVAFALSNRVAVGGAEWLVLPLPDWAMRAANLLRASERMFWPAFYALAVAGVALVARRWGERAAAGLLAAALLAQTADGGAAWARARANLNPLDEEAWEPLRGPFWDAAARDYDRVRTLPLANHAPGWQAVGRWASANNLPTDAVYLARVDGRALAETRAAVEWAFGEGRVEPRTLYVLNSPEALPLAALALDPAADLLAEADGLGVFAPGWKRRRAVPDGVREIAVEDPRPAAAPGAPLRFEAGAPAGDGAALPQGWSFPSGRGRWNDGPGATIALRLQAPEAGGGDEPLELWVKGAAFLPPQRPEQRVAVSVLRGPEAGGGACGEAAAEWRFGGAEGGATEVWRSVAVPPCAEGAPRAALLVARLRFPDAARPSDLRFSADSRLLAFSVAELVLLRRGDRPP